MAARLAGFGLRIGPAPDAQPPERATLEAPSFEQERDEVAGDLMKQAPARSNLAVSGIQRFRKWLAASHTFRDG